jgi:hypothetical protein
MLDHVGTIIAALAPELASAGVATEAGTFEDWLATDLATRSAQRVLVVSAQPLDRSRIPTSAGPTALCCPRPGHDDSLADLGVVGSFDVVYLCEIAGIAVDARWLDRAHRMLRPEGRIVLAVEPSEFSFAPLPAGGDARLLGRILTEAGFCRVQIVLRTARLIIATAQRTAGDRER